APGLSLSPDPLYLIPGQEATMLCDISCYYPLDVSVSWTRKRPSGNGTAEPVTGSWLSGHRQNPDGTYNVTSYIAVRPGWGDHDTVYTCHVEHVSARSVMRKSVTLKVAGFAGPSIDDAIGMFICAFILYGTLKFFYWIFTEKVYPLVWTPVQEVKEKRN
ncbi:tapasin-like, partial [Mustelus asterias]